MTVMFERYQLCRLLAENRWPYVRLLVFRIFDFGL